MEKILTKNVDKDIGLVLIWVILNRCHIQCKCWCIDKMLPPKSYFVLFF